MILACCLKDPACVERVKDTPEGRLADRRTLIIMPKLDQFYDLLNPNMVPQEQS